MDSSQVRLEVAILAGDVAASPPPLADKVQTILIIGSDDAIRDRFRESLRDRTDVRLVVAPTVAALLALAKVDEAVARLLG